MDVLETLKEKLIEDLKKCDTRYAVNYLTDLVNSVMDETEVELSDEEIEAIVDFQLLGKLMPPEDLLSMEEGGTIHLEEDDVIFLIKKKIGSHMFIIEHNQMTMKWIVSKTFDDADYFISFLGDIYEYDDEDRHIRTIPGSIFAELELCEES